MMRSIVKEEHKKLDVAIFRISYFFLFAYAFFGHIGIMAEILNPLAIIGMLGIAISFINQACSDNLRTILRSLLLLAIAGSFIAATGNFAFLKLVLLLIASRNIPFRERLSFDLVLRIGFSILLITLSQTGIIEDQIAQFDDGSGTIKHSLGFSNANMLGLHMLVATFELLYLSNFKISGWKALLYAIAIGSINIATQSRTAFFVSTLSLVLVYFYNKNPKIIFNGFTKKILILSPIIISLIMAIVLSYAFNHPELRYSIDQATSGRATNAMIYTNNFPITLLGNDITVTGKTCDITQIYVLYGFGIIGAIIALYSFTRLFAILYEKDEKLLLLLVLFIVFGMSEKAWLLADYNIFLTSFTYLLYKEDLKLSEPDSKGEIE